MWLIERKQINDEYLLEWILLFVLYVPKISLRREGGGIGI